MKDAHLLQVLPEETDLNLDFAAGVLAASVGTALCNLFAATCEVTKPVIQSSGRWFCWSRYLSKGACGSECVLILVLFCFRGG